MQNAKNSDLPEAANQKDIEERLKKVLGPNAEEATHEEAESLRKGEELPSKPEAKNTPGAPEVQPGDIIPPTTDPAESPSEPKPETPLTKEEKPYEPTEDTKTAEAVDEIVSEEGDAVLAAEDAEVAKAFEPADKSSFKDKFISLLQRWWNNPKARWTTLIMIVIIIGAALSIPVSRYFILNTTGVRSSVNLSVLDDTTQQPLKNVSVKIGTASASTDSDGNARVSNVKLGKAQLVIEKRAFAPVTRNMTVGWGSNPIGNISLKAVGAQYIFNVKDWLSSKPIEKAEASSDDASAVSDKNGKIVLTVDTGDAATIEVTIKADSYRDEKLTFGAANKAQQQVAMVSDRKEVFISKRSGKYDLYKVDVDGKNETLVLAGTGNEQDNMAIIPHPSDEVAAYVSTRDNVRNKDGYLLSTLLVIDLSDNSTTNIAQSERIQPLGWIGSRLIYAQITAGASGNNPKRYRLMSYDYKSSDKRELASSNSFNDALIAGENIYYAPSSAFQTSSNIGLFRSNADGSSKLSISNQEVWNIFRTAYDKFELSVQQDWYEYKIGDVKTNKLSGQPSDLNGRVYIDSPDSKHSLWVDQRDGKGVLLAYDTSAKSDTILRTQSGLSNPLRWLNDYTVIFRVHTDQETADYVMNLQGGDAKKIKDVTNTLGIDKWYYY